MLFSFPSDGREKSWEIRRKAIKRNTDWGAWKSPEEKGRHCAYSVLYEGR